MKERNLLGSLNAELKSNNSEEEYDSYGTIVWKIGKDTLNNIVTFNYNVQVPWVLWLIGHLPLPINNGDNTKSLAAAALAIFVFDTGIIIPGVMCFVPLLELGELLPLMAGATDAKERKDYKRQVESVIKNTLFLASPIVLIFTSALIFSKPLLINVFRQDEEIVDMAVEFLPRAAAFISLTTIRFTIQQLLLNFDKKMKKKVIGVCVSSLAVGGVILSYGLGYGKMHMPEKGVEGILWGMGVENALCLGGLIVCFKLSEFFKVYRFAQSWNREDWTQIKKLFWRALPIVGANFSELFTTLTKTFLAGALGPKALAAQNFAAQVTFITLLPAFGLAIAVLTRVSNLKNLIHKSRAAHAGLLTNLIAGIIVLVPVTIYPEMLNIFTAATPEVMSEAKFLVRTTAVASIFYMFGLTMLYTLRTVPGNDFKATVTFNAWLWMSAAGAYVLAFPLKLGVAGIGISTLIFTFFGAAHLLKYYLEAFPISRHLIQEDLREIDPESRPKPPRRLEIIDEEEKDKTKGCGDCFTRAWNKVSNAASSLSNSVFSLFGYNSTPATSSQKESSLSDPLLQIPASRDQSGDISDRSPISESDGGSSAASRFS